MTARAQVTFAHVSGKPEDAVVNTFHFGILGDLPDLADVTGPLNVFYNDVAAGGSGQSLSAFFSPSLSRVVAPTVKLYDAEEDIAGAPYASGTLSVLDAPLSTSPLPAEVAVVMSYRAVAAVNAGAIPARARGRIYLGPLNSNASETYPAGHARPAVGLIATLSLGGQNLITNAVTAGAPWVVFSEKDHPEYDKPIIKKPPQPNNAAHIVDAGYIDNAFDTQRRRGEDASQRFQFGTLP